jgi:hypothetical protein
MRDDEIAKHEAAAQDIIQALARLSHDVRASPDFGAQILAKVDHIPLPRRRLRHWRVRATWWPSAPAWRWVIATGLLLALAGAIPQYATWMTAYVWDIPAAAIHEAKVQHQLWQKNFVCAPQLDGTSSNYVALTNEHVNVVVWTCPSGDVLVTVQALHEPSSQRSVWIGLDVSVHLAQRFAAFIPHVFAAEKPLRTERRAVPVVRVLCQRWLPKHLIKRRVKFADGRCQDQVINSRNGKMIEHEDAACEVACEWEPQKS